MDFHKQKYQKSCFLLWQACNEQFVVNMLIAKKIELI